MLNDVKLTRRRLLVTGSAAAASFVAGGLLAACGGADDDPTGDDGGNGQGGTGDPIFVTEAEVAVLQVEYEGGRLFHLQHGGAPDGDVRSGPLVSLFNDGSLIYPGPMPEIFPQPAAPNLLVTTLSDKGVQAVGQKVLETGRFEYGDKYDYSSNTHIADAAYTIFTVRLAGQDPIRLSVYALEFDADESNLSKDEAEARRQLRELLNYVTSAPTGFPPDHIAQSETKYEPERLEIVVYPWDEIPWDEWGAIGYDFKSEPQAKQWPLDEAPEEMTEPYDYLGLHARCAELTGDQAETMLAALADANILTRWEHQDEAFYMINRALLPGEEACLSPFYGGTPDLGGSTPDLGGVIEYPQGEDELVLRYEVTGGLVPIEYLVTATPVVSIYGDGRVFTHDGEIGFYPPPALPLFNLEILTPEGIGRVLQEAQFAGLLEGEQTWNDAAQFIADAETGVLTIHAGGEMHVASVYAPYGTADMPSMLSAEEMEFRGNLGFLVGNLQRLRMWLPPSVFTDVGDEIPYDRLRIVSQPADVLPVPADVQPNELDWPLATPLSEMGEPHSLIEMGRCFVLDGQEFADVMSLMHEATTLTRWNSAGEQYVLYVRPLLPDEEGCQDPLQ